MNMVILLAMIGVGLGALSLEAILLILLETPKGKKFGKTIKNKIRHFFWKYFDWENDFIEK